MTREISLAVNEVPIALDYFVEGFIDHTVGGMVAALEGTEEIESLELSIDGENVTINLNNAPVPINAFVTKIVSSTISGMFSALKGVDRIDRANLIIRR